MWRTTRAPYPISFARHGCLDEDRYWIAIGGTYAVTDAISIDAGYTHIFVKDASIDEDSNVTPNGSVAGTLNGDYNERIDIFGIQVTSGSERSTSRPVLSTSHDELENSMQSLHRARLHSPPLSTRSRPAAPMIHLLSSRRANVKSWKPSPNVSERD